MITLEPNQNCELNSDVDHLFLSFTEMVQREEVVQCFIFNFDSSVEENLEHYF